MNLFRQQGQGILDRRSNLPGGQTCCGRVDGLNGHALPFREEFRRKHLPAQQGTGHFPAEQVGFPFLEEGGNIFVVEKGKGQVGFSVGSHGFIEGFSPSDSGFRGSTQHLGLDHSHFV